MHLALQVDADPAKGADDDVGADAAVERHVATRILQPHIRRIVVNGDADLPFGGARGRELERRRRGDGAQRDDYARKRERASHSDFDFQLSFSTFHLPLCLTIDTVPVDVSLTSFA